MSVVRHPSLGEAADGAAAEEKARPDLRRRQVRRLAARVLAARVLAARGRRGRLHLPPLLGLGGGPAGEPRGQLSMTYQVGCYAVALWAKSISNLQAIEFVLDHNAETSEGVFLVEFAGDDAGRATRSRSS